jgi:hypothetical protein
MACGFGELKILICTFQKKNLICKHGGIAPVHAKWL